MKFDIFFSISQTPVDGFLPDEATMFRNFFAQVEAADVLGYGVAWVAESHFSSEVQKRHRKPVIPFWNGEVGLNGDICQLAAHVFKRTKRIHVGSAVMNIVCNGGPLAHAEKIATFATLHGLDHDEHRQLHVGFSAGRFDFMNRVTGIDGRNAWEESAWPLVKNKVFWEASEIFLRLLRGETLASDAVPEYSLRRADCRNEAEWEKIRDLAGSEYDAKAEAIPIPRRWRFEPTRIVPAHWRRELVVPVLGSHDAPLQEYVNRFRPVQIFNLSITRPEIIEDTHRRMAAAYHHDGGPWRRDYMPRTVFVFINAQGHLSPEQQRHHAQEEAQAALGAYWRALDGTLDPSKVVNAADNALIGNPEDIARQILERFHPEDRLMLWFDFFNHDNARVIANMEAFMREVAPKVEAALAEGRA
ncbi:MAG TPA: LLM class flavin-dependent oxidoreductase [Holophagaceae bacterium]|nr:LLM class flavin-dependent oxidoreductase [Holophagaceae bacterium]